MKTIEDKTYKIPEKEWVYKNYKCKVHFYENKWRCGYAQIPKTHPCFLVSSYDDIPIDAHGGLTYGGYSKKLNENWLGFDTAHAGDRRADEEESKGHFWTLEEVMKETEGMVDQLEKLTLMDCVKRKTEYFPDWFKDNFIIVLKQKSKGE